MAQAGQTNKPNNFNWKKLIVTLILIIGLVVLGLWYFNYFESDNATEISLSKLKELLKGISGDNEGVESISYNQGSLQWRIIYKTSSSTNEYFYNQVSFGLPVLKEYFGEIINNDGTAIPIKEIDWYSEIDVAKQVLSIIRPKTQSMFTSILISMVPMLLFFFLISFFMRRAGSAGQGGIMSIGKNPAQKITSNKTFADVAGQEEVKEEVVEVIDFLKRPNKYKKAGARIPKGIMLAGPPGTGKTLVAKAVAGEAGVPFYFISASNFVEMFAGMGAKRVREMFKDARKNAPAILFIDEMDAVGRKRGSSMSGNDEREQTLNQILVELDGMVESNGLLVIAATNRPDVLDPALMRPGRFDRTITIRNPDIREREEILKLHAKGKRISKDVDFKNIAKRTPGYSGAELENVINEATLLSVRENTELVMLEQVDEAIDRVMAGPSKKHRIITPEENKLVAIHEAGHAVVGLKVEDADIVQKITIIPRGDAGGYTLSIPKKEQYNYRKSQLEAKIMGLLGGRASEQVYYGKGEVTTGAHNDIQKATSIARAMVTQYGMSILGPIAYEKPTGSQFLGMDTREKDYSDALAEKIDEAIRILVAEAEEKAIKIIEKNKKLIDLIVLELIEKETIVVEEIDYINKYEKRPPKKTIKKAKAKTKSLDELIEEVKDKPLKKVTKKIKK